MNFQDFSDFNTDFNLSSLKGDISGQIDQQQLSKYEGYSDMLKGDVKKGGRVDSDRSNPSVITSESQEPTVRNTTSYTAPALFFPSDLGQSSNNSHYVQLDVFVVNAGSFFEKNKGSTNETKKPRNTEGTSQNLDANFTKLTNFMENNPSGNETVDATSKAIAPAKYVNLEWVFGFPMPDSIVTDHSTMWGRKEGGMLSGLISTADTLSDSEARKKLEWLKMGAMGVASSVSGLMNSVGLEGANVAFEVATKRSSNPRNEYLFDGVNNRSFNLQWKFFPKDMVEAERLHEMITKLRLLMYPDIDVALNQSYYIYPAIFEITFYSSGTENEWLHKTSSCALTNIILNATPTGQWVAVDSQSSKIKGAPPIGYEMTMQFTELEYLHRARFEEGTVR